MTTMCLTARRPRRPWSSPRLAAATPGTARAVSAESASNIERRGALDLTAFLLQVLDCPGLIPDTALTRQAASRIGHYEARTAHHARGSGSGVRIDSMCSRWDSRCGG